MINAIDMTYSQIDSKLTSLALHIELSTNNIMETIMNNDCLLEQ